MIHILFSSSAAGTLRQALDARGISECVIDLTDDLDWGPIALEGFEEREAWLDHHVPWQDGKWDWIASSPRKFQSKVENDPDRLIWIAPQSASEQCGLYWYLDRFGGADASMIIVDYPLSGAWREQKPYSLGTLGKEQIGELLDHADREPLDATRFGANRWRELCQEAALLRIVDKGAIKSESEDYFDGHLLAHCSQKWQKWHRVVGEVMGELWDENHSVDSVFLTWRLRVLAEQGKVVSNSEIIAFPEPGADTVFIRLT